MTTADTHKRLSGNVTISSIVDGTLDERRQRVWPVSIALTALAVRRRVPQCDLSDRELAELVAIRAIERGHNVVFDADLLDDR